MSLIERWREWRDSRHEDAAAAEEMEFHIEQETARNIRHGMTPEDARRAATMAFGGVDRYREQARDERTGTAAGVSWLDFKLGFRMLLKYPGLTLVGGSAIALAITVGALAFEFANQLVRPHLPLEGGDRIVAIRLWNTASRSIEEQASYDFVKWREEVQSIEDLGAYREVRRNLKSPEGPAGLTTVAQISASAFRVAATQPLLGRPLLEADEEAGAAPVVVLGERVWRRWFEGDRAIVGRPVMVGDVATTVVGVMPERFRFPINNGVWMPLRIDALEQKPREGPAIRMFGRLRAGVTREEARAELSVVSQRAATDVVDARERPEVIPYAQSFLDVSWRMVTGFAYAGNAFIVMFLVLVCANVATLIFARTATREPEIVVRNALGASRSRIVTQLLAETLVLGGVAALIGLGVARLGMQWGIQMMDSQTRVPFWVHASLSPATVAYAVALTVLAAVIAGVVPALKVTRGIADRLRNAASGGTDLKFGRMWTGLIVTQIALTMFFMTLTLDVAWDAARLRNLDFGFPAEEYISVGLELEREGSNRGIDIPFSDAELVRFQAMYEELKRRLAADARVAGVTVATSLPGTYHGRERVLAEGGAPPPRSGSGHTIQTASVDADFFDVFDARIIAGRGFEPGDVQSGRRVVVVNQAFARQVLGDGNPIGRRVRYANTPEDGAAAKEWYEIIGVVSDVAMTGDPDILNVMGGGSDGTPGGLYHVIPPGKVYTIAMAVHVKGDRDAFALPMRAIATAAAPGLLLNGLSPMEEIREGPLRTYASVFRIALLGSAIVLLLSVAGVYSIMAFTVSRRTREIGIRVALGADPRRIVLATFSRALRQVLIGVALGALGMIAAMGGILTTRGIALVGAPTAFMLAICALACIVPTRRALRIQPTDALREG